MEINTHLLINFKEYWSRFYVEKGFFFFTLSKLVTAAMVMLKSQITNGTITGNSIIASRNKQCYTASIFLHLFTDACQYSIRLYCSFLFPLSLPESTHLLFLLYQPHITLYCHNFERLISFCFPTMNTDTEECLS